MPTYNTPGVYIEEKATLPPTAVANATAIPAFIGFTELGAPDKVEVAVVTSLLEFVERFGRAKPTAYTVDLKDNFKPALPSVPERPLFYAMQMYFDNGGGRCYVVSIGNYSTAPSAARYVEAFTALELEDEPTLIAMPDLGILPQADFDAVGQKALAHCAKMDDRFAILDVRGPKGVNDVKLFREGIGTTGLSYGAAYHPYLVTTLIHRYDEETIVVTVPGIPGGDVKDDNKQTTRTLKELASVDTSRYNRIKQRLNNTRVIIPPSGAVAGVYLRVDSERGVWKAPANVSLASVIGPYLPINAEQQALLNVEPNSGKSINAIRAFAGKGTLIWGARTLAGNDNEWRYIPVRRLFLNIEDTARKATAFAVFEPNDADTWLKVKGMLDAMLYEFWEQGALQGGTPEDAYFVNVGLGKSMTPQNVLEGEMIIEIGVAAVRPAEFVIIRFSHKLAASG
jgi:phage tail sheath protein FI